MSELVYCRECYHYNGGITCKVHFIRKTHSWYNHGVEHEGYTVANANNDCAKYKPWAWWQKLGRFIWVDD
jgi:hypothetical protein